MYGVWSIPPDTVLQALRPAQADRRVSGVALCSLPFCLARLAREHHVTIPDLASDVVPEFPHCAPCLHHELNQRRD